MTLKIECKHLAEGVLNPTLADIDHFHWIEDLSNFPGVYTREELYKYIQGGSLAFILDPADPTGQKKITLTTAKTPEGKKYVNTIIDGKETDHLLRLPDCEATST